LSGRVVIIYNWYMLHAMSEKRIRQIENQIENIKARLVEIGEMRPGSLTKQYRDPKKKIGPFYQLSYTHKMKSRTEYVRPGFVKNLRLQIAEYKRFKKLTEKWIDYNTPQKLDSLIRWCNLEREVQLGVFKKWR
jgi:hypothetical protein